MVLARRGLIPALLAVLALAGGPVHAQEVDAADDSGDAAGTVLQAEVLLLVELRAFDPVPRELAAVHREWVGLTNGLTRERLLQWLYDIDGRGVAALSRLKADGDVPPAVATALGPIGSVDRLALESAQQIGIPAAAYVAAIEKLDIGGPGSRDLGLLGPGDGAASAEDAPAPTNAVADGEARGVGANRDNAGPAGAAAYPWMPVTVALFAVLIVGVFMVVVGRRREAQSGSTAAFDRLLDAGRRMTAALDRTQVAEIAAAEAATLVGGDGAALLSVRGGKLAVVSQTIEVVDDRRLEGGVLARVAATGRSFRTVSHDEPAVVALPAALLIVPVIAGGSVTGIVATVRADHAPFTADDENVLGRLAPMIGSAMAAAEVHDGVAELSRVDALTGLGNRRSLDADLAEALRTVDPTSSLGVVMIDIDHFKQFNDTNGHGAGDVALQAVANQLQHAVRAGDTVYRYGGEEFSLLLRNVELEPALLICERVRRSVEAITIPGSDSQPGGMLTTSLGLNLVTGGTVDEAISAADAALYEAKHAGRNRVAVAGEPVTAS